MNGNDLLTKSDVSSFPRTVVATTSGAVLGALIVKLRDDRHISQKDLATAIGMSPSTWSRIERGDSGLSIEQLKKVAKVLELTPWYLLQLADEEEKALKERGIYIDESFSSPKALVNTLTIGKGAGEMHTGTAVASALSGAAIGGALLVAPVGLIVSIVSIAGSALAAMLRVDNNLDNRD